MLDNLGCVFTTTLVCKLYFSALKNEQKELTEEGTDSTLVLWLMSIQI